MKKGKTGQSDKWKRRNMSDKNLKEDNEEEDKKKDGKER